MTTEELLLGELQTAAFDPAFITSFKARLIDTGLWELMGCPMPKVKRNSPPPPAPAAQDITAIRAALFDNWPNGSFVKGTPNRYALAIELWDLPGDQIEAVKLKSMNYTFKTNVSLMDRKALRAQVKHLRKPRINELSNVDPDYLDGLLEVSDQFPDVLIGMFNTTIGTDDSEYARGVYYHPMQFVMVRMSDGEVTSADVFTGYQAPIKLAPFVSRDVNGEALKGRVAAQSRTDLIGFDSTWASV